MAAVRVERAAHGGWPSNLRLSNGEVELLVTLDVGPRVLRYAPVGGPNAFAEMAGDRGGIGEATWKIRGGHRLWISPEDPARTYVPDNGPVTLEVIAGDRVRVTTPADREFALEKSLELALDPVGSRVTLIHRVLNRGERPTELAPWALSVMAGGGTAIIPLPRRVRPPGSLAAPTASDFAPTYTMALWPYFTFADPRLTFGTGHLLVRQDRTRGSTKLGLGQRAGWAAYWNEGLLFVKQFPWVDGAPYPDGGCNFECYTDAEMLELETLGPLERLSPGAEAKHVESWSLNADVPAPVDEATIAAGVLPRVLSISGPFSG